MFFMSVQLEFCKQRYYLITVPLDWGIMFRNLARARSLEGTFVNKDGWMGRNQYFGRGWDGRGWVGQFVLHNILVQKAVSKPTL